MTILVTGGAGFIGSSVVDRLIKEGYQVVILDNMITGQRNLINSQAIFYEGDILDRNLVQRIIKDHDVKRICHQAAQLDVRKSVTDPMFDANVNILGFLNLCEGARMYGVDKIVFASSGGAVYGDTDRIPTSETHPTIPISPYGVSKLSMEYYAQYYAVTYELATVALRYSNVYGPRQNAHGEAGVVAIFVDRMLEGQQCYINGDGENTRDFVYISDVVEANYLALTSDLRGIYNVSTATETSINTIFQLINQYTKSHQEPQYREAKQGEQRSSCLSFDEIKSAAGWYPKINIKLGLQQTVEYFRSP